jgi:hypothetical protein
MRLKPLARRKPSGPCGIVRSRSPSPAISTALAKTGVPMSTVNVNLGTQPHVFAEYGAVRHVLTVRRIVGALRSAHHRYRQGAGLHR